MGAFWRCMIMLLILQSLWDGRLGLENFSDVLWALVYNFIEKHITGLLVLAVAHFGTRAIFSRRHECNCSFPLLKAAPDACSPCSCFCFYSLVLLIGDTCFGFEVGVRMKISKNFSREIHI